MTLPDLFNNKVDKVPQVFFLELDLLVADSSALIASA